MVNFMNGNLNCLRVDTKPTKNEVFIFRNSIFHPFIFNHILRNVKEIIIFHSIENQHFKNINVGFFLY